MRPIIFAVKDQGRQPDLLIARLHAEEDEVRRSAGETALQIGLASYLFGLCVVVIQCLHSVLKKSPLNLETGRGVGQRTFLLCKIWKTDKERRVKYS